MLTEAEAGRLLRPEELALIRAGIELKLGSIVSGRFHADLHASARAYAETLARKNRQDGHAGWGQRSAALQRIVPSHPKLFEITSESWDLLHRPAALQHRQAVSKSSSDPIGFYSSNGADVLDAIAKSFIDAWRSSPGHWAILNGECTYYGCSVAKGSRAYYGVEIVAR